MPSYKMVMQFLDGDGKTISQTYNYVQGSPSAVSTKAAMDAIVTNGAIFKKVPVSKKACYVVATTQTNINISD